MLYLTFTPAPGACDRGELSIHKGRLQVGRATPMSPQYACAMARAMAHTGYDVDVYVESMRTGKWSRNQLAIALSSRGSLDTDYDGSVTGGSSACPHICTPGSSQ